MCYRARGDNADTMWCRALLTITLLACTLQRTNGQSHDTKDLLCVLILSGLQKDDLDVALLKKLQRHNVNVDDLDNVYIRNECKLENAKHFDNETKYDEQKSTRRQFQTNTSDKVEVQNIVFNSTIEDASITKLMKLISGITPEVKLMSSKTPKVNHQSIEEISPTTEVVTRETRTKSEPNSITYINKVLQQFIAQVGTVQTTTTPTTTVDLKSILYEIKDMLANKGESRRKGTPNIKNGRQYYNYDEDRSRINVNSKDIDDRMMFKRRDMRGQRENVELKDRTQEDSKERPIKDVVASLIGRSLSPNRPSTTEGPMVKERFQNDIKIPGNIIKDIADSVKALVLRDINIQMNTNSSRRVASETDINLTTTVTTISSTKQENDLAKLIEIINQLKDKLNPVVNKNVTGHKQSERLDNVAPTLTTMPYQNPIIRHIIHSIQVPNALRKLNTELESIPIYKSNTINRIDQVNFYNPKPEIHPLTIQTNIGQIPPLKVPMMLPPVKMIYQNIVVTTENSFEFFKNVHRLKVKSHPNIQYSHNIDNKNLGPDPLQDAVMKRLHSPPQHDYPSPSQHDYPSPSQHDYPSPPQHDYSNPSQHDYPSPSQHDYPSPPQHDYPNPSHHDYPTPFDRPKYHYNAERMETPSNYISPKYNAKEKYSNVRTRNHDFEKFHEKLERVDRDDWHQSSNEPVAKMKVAQRALRPINDTKPKFDDTHFKNFLKTQQKVNNMLERILATKTVELAKSVEVP